MRKKLFLVAIFVIMFSVILSTAVMAEGRVAIVFATGGLGISHLMMLLLKE